MPSFPLKPHPSVLLIHRTNCGKRVGTEREEIKFNSDPQRLAFCNMTNWPVICLKFSLITVIVMSNFPKYNWIADAMGLQ